VSGPLHRQPLDGGTKRRYPAHVKTEAVRRVRVAREPVAVVARDLSVKAGSLYIWLRKADILDPV
jgi:transposase-like protein